jgi:LmeA-like phospholipid-binding
VRRLLRWLLAPIILAAALFVVANLVVQHIAESKIASTLQSTFHLSTRPSVSIGGFPIIANILGGHVPRVSFSAPAATFQGLTMRDINVTLVDVRADGGFLHNRLRIRVGGGTIRARATNAAVNAYFKDHGQNATIVFRPGRATVRAVRSFLGRSHTLVASGTVSREGSSLVFRPTSVTVDGRAPPPGTESLAEQKTTIRMQLPKLPGGISSYGIKAVDGAAALSAVLHDQVLDLSS